MRAVVTGANRGIGRATAMALGRGGYRVTVHYRRHAEEAAEVVRELREAGGEAEAVGADLSDPGDVDRFSTHLLAEPSPLEVLVHNAGEYPRTALATSSAAELRALLESHVVAPFELTRRLQPRLARADPGRVVFVSSVLAFLGTPHGAPYAAAKAAQLGLVRALARELAPQVRVNAVAPGSIDTAILAGDTPERRSERERSIPLGRLGRPEEVAEAIAFLVSRSGSYVSGTTLHVNGGLIVP